MSSVSLLFSIKNEFNLMSSTQRLEPSIEKVDQEIKEMIGAVSQIYDAVMTRNSLWKDCKEYVKVRTEKLTKCQREELARKQLAEYHQ